MLVVCTSIEPSQKQKQLLGKYANRAFHLTIGKKYLVFALTIASENVHYVQILTDYGHLVSVPFFLFSFLDSRVSRYWEMRTFEDGVVTFWPPSFYTEFYHDDLFEEIDSVVQDFTQVRIRLEREFEVS
ncbi:hypothetical protein [Deminuibacter soli]|uniref:Uncharacterized protein n=1 Tax=Deminuibacter soli TaxID=2291815 RepID=A0A3E1NMA9_9BACT|nr:hypothetical protein [Deminuibacter soli]RFM29070.1 hypothetical protein DXN05_09945 [Deminuibacter soli]